MGGGGSWRQASAVRHQGLRHSVSEGERGRICAGCLEARQEERTGLNKPTCIPVEHQPSASHAFPCFNCHPTITPSTASQAEKPKREPTSGGRCCDLLHEGPTLCDTGQAYDRDKRQHPSRPQPVHGAEVRSVLGGENSFLLPAFLPHPAWQLPNPSSSESVCRAGRLDQHGCGVTEAGEEGRGSPREQGVTLAPLPHFFSSLSSPLCAFFVSPFSVSSAFVSFCPLCSLPLLWTAGLCGHQSGSSSSLPSFLHHSGLPSSACPSLLLPHLLISSSLLNDKTPALLTGGDYPDSGPSPGSLAAEPSTLAAKLLLLLG